MLLGVECIKPSTARGKDPGSSLSLTLLAHILQLSCLLHLSSLPLLSTLLSTTFCSSHSSAHSSSPRSDPHLTGIGGAVSGRHSNSNPRTLQATNFLVASHLFLSPCGTRVPW